MGDILLGCSGWDYEEWIGPFYESRKGSKLAAYSRTFPTAEINSTFYRVPSQGMVIGWARYTPEDFVFCAKVPQAVTHDKLLRMDKGAHKDLQEFCDIMRPLQDAGKLGALLIQLPPRLRFHRKRVEEFFEHLPAGYRFAIEFRNESWMCAEALDLLTEHAVAYTVVDEPLLPPEVHLTSEVAYFRWHGHGKDPWYNYRYTRKELEPWVPKLQQAAQTSKTVYGYFNNHFHGYAPENCLEVLEMLGALTPEQARALRRIRGFRKGIMRTPHGRLMATTLEDFDPGVVDVEDMLRQITTSPRLERARHIAATGVELETEGRLVRGEVGQYTVFIDAEQRILRHDCEDWKKNLPDGPLCKHISALFLSMPRALGNEILRDLMDSRQRWTLET